MGPKLTLNWRYFSLEQVNNKQEPQWKIWEQPDDYPTRGLRAFRAAEAARRQGEAAFSIFHAALLKVKHEQRRDIADTDTLIEVAESAGLEMTRFQEDFGDRGLLAKLIEDHTFAVDTLAIFGTPTLVFPERRALFLRLESAPSSNESLTVFAELRHLAEHRQYILEIKRP